MALRELRIDEVAEPSFYKSKDMLNGAGVSTILHKLNNKTLQFDDDLSIESI